MSRESSTTRSGSSNPIHPEVFNMMKQVQDTFDKMMSRMNARIDAVERSFAAPISSTSMPSSTTISIGVTAAPKGSDSNPFTSVFNPLYLVDDIEGIGHEIDGYELYAHESTLDDVIEYDVHKQDIDDLELIVNKSEFLCANNNDLNVHETELDVDRDLTCDYKHGMVEFRHCIPRKSLDECCIFEDDRVLEVDKVVKVYRPPSSLRNLSFMETHRRDLLFERDKSALMQPPCMPKLIRSLMIQPAFDLCEPNQDYLGVCAEELPWDLPPIRGLELTPTYRIYLKETCEEKSHVWKIIDPYRKGISFEETHRRDLMCSLERGMTYYLLHTSLFWPSNLMNGESFIRKHIGQVKVRSRCEAYIDVDKNDFDNIVANADLRSYIILPILDLRILGVIHVKKFFVGSYELWDAFMQNVDRGPLGLICVMIEVPKLDYLEDESRAKREHKTAPIPPSLLMPLKVYVRDSYIDICVVYIDDIFMHNTSLRAHKEHLREVLSTPRLEYLNYIFDAYEFRPYWVLCFAFLVSSQGVQLVNEVPAPEEMLHVILQPRIGEKEEAYDSRSNPFQEGENDAGASKDQTQLKTMSNGTRRRRVMLILRRRRGRLKLIQDFDHHIRSLEEQLPSCIAYIAEHCQAMVYVMPSFTYALMDISAHFKTFLYWAYLGYFKRQILISFISFSWIFF